jgi:hypothetical protein
MTGRYDAAGPESEFQPGARVLRNRRGITSVRLLASEWTPRRNGARIPSIAEDVATDLVTVFSLNSGLRRYRLTKESFAPIH